MDDAKVDLDRLTETAWRRFRTAVAEVLDALPERGMVQIALDAGVDLDGAAPYVQAVRLAETIVLEVVSNRFLASSFRLTKPSRKRLRQMGLAKPTGEAPNYWVHLPATHVDQVASLIVTVFRQVYGVMHPAFLLSDDVKMDDDPTLPATDLRPEAPVAVYPVDRDHLDRLIEEALTPMLGHTPERDDDGDIPFRAGTAVVYVRNQGRTPVIRLFAQMVVQITDIDAARYEVIALNRDVQGVKFALHGDQVLASADLFALPFASDHLRCMLTRVCDVVSSHDTDLARRTGGRVFLHPEDVQEADGAAASEEEAADSIHPVMLCMLQLDAEEPGSLRPKVAAKLCNNDSDLLLELIRWNEVQEIAWREARDEACATHKYDEAAVCEIERAHARRTVKVLRKALSRVLLG